MKNEPTCVKKFATLHKKIKAAHKPAPYPAVDPVMQIVASFLEWNATRAAAELAQARLMEFLVDANDLRVSHPHEIVDLIGEEYPLAEERATRLHEVLQEIFVREHMVSLAHLQSKTKKQVVDYLESIPAITPYVSAATALNAFGVHVVPVDNLIAAALKAEGAADESSTLEEISAFLEKQIKAGEAVELFLLLRDWADSTNKIAPHKKKVVVEAPPKPVVEEAKPVKKKAAKK